uniref:Uncharacterized protein n=1 Tax=Anguilla anguilla TaxID=7936 RepID=A0A0E9UEB2_ANGAN
MSPGTQAS